MSIVQELEKIITELPPRKASNLKYWLEEYKAARRYRQLKSYIMASKILAHFGKSNSDASLN